MSDAAARYLRRLTKYAAEGVHYLTYKKAPAAAVELAELGLVKIEPHPNRAKCVALVGASTPHS